MGGAGAVLTGVRGREDGWETLGKNCEKNTVGNDSGNKTNQGKKTSAKTQGKTKRCNARLTKNTGEFRWSKRLMCGSEETVFNVM